jgi:hypothetical protein
MVEETQEQVADISLVTVVVHQTLELVVLHYLTE